MIMHITIHHPHPENAQQLTDAMHRFEQVVRSRPGVLSAHTLKDTRTGALVELAVWSTKEAWLAAQQTIDRAESTEEVADWEAEPPVTYHLEEI